jgi:uncharacterized peroxidase-related enzyme
MPHILPVPRVRASAESRVVYDEFYRKMSFPAPPNFIMTQGHSATVARGTWEAVRNVLVTGRIPRWVKEVMFVAISQDRKCGYCTAAHIACCRMLGVDLQILDALARDVRTIGDAKVRDIVLFGLKSSRDPSSLVTADFDSLKQHGLDDADIVEVIAMSALAVYANIMADATAMDPDEMFATVGAGPKVLR